MIAKATMPNKIRIELVLIFILHLQVVLLMDGIFNMKVPHISPCHKTVTGNEINHLESKLVRNHESF
jgi:hypothetical protein